MTTGRERPDAAEPDSVFFSSLSGHRFGLHERVYVCGPHECLQKTNVPTRREFSTIDPVPPSDPDVPSPLLHFYFTAYCGLWSLLP